MPKPIAADLTGKTCVVTGANTGIGKECARALALLGARVVMACRSPERGQAALDELQATTGNAYSDSAGLKTGSNRTIMYTPAVTIVAA